MDFLKKRYYIESIIIMYNALHFFHEINTFKFCDASKISTNVGVANLNP